MQCEIIVFKVLHPPMLPHVEIPLREYVLKTFVVREYLELLSIQIMTSCFQGKDNGRQLHIVCRVILLVILQLPRTISHNPPGLHQTHPSPSFEASQYTVYLFLLSFLALLRTSLGHDLEGAYHLYRTQACIPHRLLTFLDKGTECFPLRTFPCQMRTIA